MFFRFLLVFFFLITLVYFLRNLVYYLLKGLGAGRKVREAGTKREIHGGQMVRDPVCGIYLPKDIAIRKVIQGKEFYFCSEECKKRFTSDGRVERG